MDVVLLEVDVEVDEVLLVDVEASLPEVVVVEVLQDAEDEVEPVVEGEVWVLERRSSSNPTDMLECS